MFPLVKYRVSSDAFTAKLCAAGVGISVRFVCGSYASSVFFKMKPGMWLHACIAEPGGC